MRPAGRLARAITGWVAWVSRHPLWVVVAVALLVAAVVPVAARHLSITTDTDEMLAPDLPFQVAARRLKGVFPQYSDTIVVVVEAADGATAVAAAERLAERLRGLPDLFATVYLPGGGPFFERNALLYLDPKGLDALADRLAEVQPFLGRLTRDRSLRGLSEMVTAALDAAHGGEQIDLDPLLERLADGVEAVEGGRPYRLPWTALMGGKGTSERGRRRFLLLQPRLDYTALLPAAAPMATLHRLRHELHLDGRGTARMWITGDVALAHEELLSVERGAVLAGGLAMGMVAVVLFAGLGSVRLVAATLLTLLAGLAFTAAFAALAVGHLNMISVAFAVLYIGLGVDYAIHLCLRYRERLVDDGDAAAMAHAAGDVGGALVVCTLTTAIGFFSFIPTAYKGVSELGIIAGGGMFIGLATTLTLLPALVALRPLSPRRAARRPLALGRFAGALLDLPVRHRRGVLGGTAVVAVVSVVLLPWVRFDHNPLHLMDPKSESVATFQRLLADSELSPWSISILALADRVAAEQGRLRRLETVAQVLTVDDFIPADQAEKLDTIEEIALLLGPDLSPAATPPPPVAAEVAGLKRLRVALGRTVDGGGNGEGGEAGEAAALRLATALDHLLGRWARQPAVRASEVSTLEESLLGGLDGALARLRTALTARRVSRAELPPALVARWVSGDLHRIQVFPRDDLNRGAAMRRFVRQVQSVAPQASGAPVVYLAAGRAVVSSFRHAFLYALAAITLLLTLLVRPRRDILLVLLPLLLAGIVTGAATVILHLPFNFANVIALPLLLGIGVDSGLHMVHRARADLAGARHPLATSTARAVFYSALTTVCSFGNLAFSPHRGTASMGVLLTLGVGLTLVATLLVLPALLLEPAAAEGRG